MSTSRSNTTSSKSLGTVGKAWIFGLALSGSMVLFGGTAGAAASGEAELGSALSATMSMSASAEQTIQLTEIEIDGTVRTITIPADSGIPLSGIDQARQWINLAAM